MIDLVPESHRDLLRDDVRALAFLATRMADGSPQVTPVWFDTDDECIRINTAEGRTKWRNMQARPEAAVAILDPANPYRYLQIRGPIVDWTTEGAREHIHRLARKYQGVERYGGPPDERRVIFRLRPNAVSVQG
jgi:PPOX class probable F420-dependent enzyme